MRLHLQSRLHGRHQQQVDRTIAVAPFSGERGPTIVREAKEGAVDLILMPLPEGVDRTKDLRLPDWIMHVLQNARCRVMLIANPALPRELAE